jgi:hypothetical protein
VAIICKPGDRVICKIKDDDIVPTYESKWERKQIFDIAAKCPGEGHIVVVPSSLFLKYSKTLTASNYKDLGVDKIFIGSTVCYIDDFRIYEIYSVLDGKSCKRCNEFCQMAEGNQKDGSFLCYVCRKRGF